VEVKGPLSPAPDADYFRLRTEWLRFKGHLFDALTGLPALPAVMEDIRRLLESQRALEVLYVDLGRSGWHETKLGWAAYDNALKTFASILRGLREKGVLDPDDVACLHTVRSDRFLIFLGGGEQRLTGAATRRDRILSEMQAALRAAPPEAGLRAIRLAVGHAEVSEHPMARSERGVQQAVSDAILMSLKAREGIEAARHAELSRLIAEGGVRTVFHPIVTLADRRGIGHEALTRVVRPTSFDSVEELFAFAESTDLLVDFERLCRGVAIRTSPGLQTRGLLFLNASAPAVLDPEWFSGAMEALLGRSGMTPRDVVVEITERLAVGRHHGFQGALRKLKERGYRVAVDDMGAGHASLQALASIEPDFLKFDVSLVRDIDKSSIKRSLLETLRGLAEKMRARVIAEGIEREGERETLQSLGIELGQGFLFHREEPA
jgi:EAL domain-containing protein (putative c-di-GMP-specific phosphodiesterase class I)/GGDEF domain-containing protein